jgi:hypothetical protein
MGDRHDPRRAIHRPTEVVTVAKFRSAGMHPRPHLQGDGQSGAGYRCVALSDGGRKALQGTLQGNPRGDRIRGNRKYGMHTIARALDDVTMVGLYRVTHQCVVAR